MNEELNQVKKKKEFSYLPDSLIERALILSKKDIKKCRAILRKYFLVFSTNKVLKINDERILKSHFSSKNRDYPFFYNKIFEKNKNFSNILDLGSGINSFSYLFLKEILGEVNYICIEAEERIVQKTNDFFNKKGFLKARAIQEDLFNLGKIEEIISSLNSPTAIFLFQVIDALEFFERDYSKKLLLMIKNQINEKDLIVISMPTKTISKKKSFEAKRTWLKLFLEENFFVEDFFLGDERIFKCRKK